MLRGGGAEVCLSAVLGPGPVPHAPLEVGLGVGLDEGVDGPHPAGRAVVRGGGGGVSGGGGPVAGRRVPPHSVHGGSLAVIQQEHAAGRGAHEGEEEDLRVATTLIYANLDLASLSPDTHKSGVHGVGVSVAVAGVKLAVAAVTSPLYSAPPLP